MAGHDRLVGRICDLLRNTRRSGGQQRDRGGREVVKGSKHRNAVPIDGRMMGYRRGHVRPLRALMLAEFEGAGGYFSDSECASR